MVTLKGSILFSFQIAKVSIYRYSVWVSPITNWFQFQFLFTTFTLCILILNFKFVFEFGFKLNFRFHFLDFDLEIHFNAVFRNWSIFNKISKFWLNSYSRLKAQLTNNWKPLTYRIFCSSFFSRSSISSLDFQFSILIWYLEFVFDFNSNSDLNLG